MICKYCNLKLSQINGELVAEDGSLCCETPFSSLGKENPPDWEFGIGEHEIKK